MKDRLITMEMMRDGLMMEMVEDRLIGRLPARSCLEELGGYMHTDVHFFVWVVNTEFRRLNIHLALQGWFSLPGARGVPM